MASFPSCAGSIRHTPCRCVYAQTYVHMSGQMWVDSEAWQDHCGSRDPSPLLPHPSKGQEVEGMADIGLQPCG